jgi:hypothetical protein
VEFGTSHNAIQLAGGSGAGAYAISANSGEIILNAAEVTVTGAAVNVGSNGGKVGFLGASPVVQQMSGGDVAGVIAGLVALGLFSS